MSVFIQFSPKFVSEVPIDNNQAQFRYLDQYWQLYLMLYVSTKPQWVNKSSECKIYPINCAHFLSHPSLGWLFCCYFVVVARAVRSGGLGGLVLDSNLMTQWIVKSVFSTEKIPPMLHKFGQLSCSDTSQIWVWFKGLNSYIKKITISIQQIKLMNKALINIPTPGLKAGINSLWPSDARWRHRTGSTLVQAMACCLTVPSHYLNQCWLIISNVQWHLSKGNSTRNDLNISH